MSLTRSTSTGWIQETRGVTRSTSTGWLQARPEIIVPPVVEEAGPRGGHQQHYDHHARILREDEDILAVIMAYMETRH